MAATSSGVDAEMLNKMGNHLKSQGIFDQFRRDCLEDVDTKPAYQNLRQKVEGYVSAFLAKVNWEPKLNKNQLRDSLRRQINQSEMLSAGVERIIEQVIEPKMQHVFRPQIEKVVDEFLGPKGSKEAENLKKDLATTSGMSHPVPAPAPPDLPPEVPTPAPPLPPSEPPAAPPQAPPEAPPDEPPDDPVACFASHPDHAKPVQSGTSPTVSSGGNTPSFTSSKMPGLVKKHSGGVLATTSDVKGEKKPVLELPGEVKSAIPAKGPSVKTEPMKSQPGKPQPVKDQDARKVATKDQPAKTQPSKVIKKVPSGSKLVDAIKPTDKPRIVISSNKPPALKIKIPEEFKKVEDRPTLQATVKEPGQDSETKPQPLDVEKVPICDQLLLRKAASEVTTLEPDTDSDVVMDVEPSQPQPRGIQGEQDERRSCYSGKGEESDGESGLSDISVSSVHTSDLSSFDEDFSSSSSSSSSDSSSEEETTKPKQISLKKKPFAHMYPSDSDSEAPSEVTISTDTSRPASVASDKLSARRSPKTQTPSARALAISRYHSDSEDEDSRQERRKKAALAKEERARRRQMAKEEREKVLAEKLEKRALDPETADDSGEAKKAARREDLATASPLKTTKEQLKEQKMLEKKREVRRRRSLNKRYFSDEFSSSMQGVKEPVSQQEDDEEKQQEVVQAPDLVPLTAFIRREKLQCFHLIYRERREPQVRCHHLLTQGLSGEQQRKLSSRKRKERRDSKVPRFSFPQGKAAAAAGVPGERSGKPTSSLESARGQKKLGQEQVPEKKQGEEVSELRQTSRDVQDNPGEKNVEQLTGDEEVEKRDGSPELQAEPIQGPPDEQQQVGDVPASIDEEESHLIEQQGKLVEEFVQEEIQAKEEVQQEAKPGGVQDELWQLADEPMQDLQEQKGEEMQRREEQDKRDEPPEEKNGEVKGEGEELPNCNQASEPEAEKLPEETGKEVVEDTTQEEQTVQDEVPEDVTKMDCSEEQTVGKTALQETVELSLRDATPYKQGANPPQVKDIEPAAATEPTVPSELPSDEIDNPPTPTQDEPSIYPEADSESEEHSDKGSSIPIYTVHSPKHLPLGSVFKLSQTSLQDMKPLSGVRVETKTVSKDSNASAADDSEKHSEASYQLEDSHDSNTDSDKHRTGTKVSHSELQDKPTASETSESSQAESRYGTRPKRHATSPRDSQDDDYFYYGQPKRGRYSQSPISPQEEGDKAGRSRARRVSTDSGKSDGTGREAAETPTRPLRQRHVSPPRRYSPSDTRVSHRRSSTSVIPHLRCTDGTRKAVEAGLLTLCARALHATFLWSRGGQAGKPLLRYVLLQRARVP
ncbi:biorientation of chromosomes in cell division protein 1-like 1 [Acanthaster planci]|uniref:Biorientation of chromosomes in cell division protein 1-like 1 n=1 Tax=Acanthaster planci TaxID=133434 RepID=A0A8B7Y215_ACAPL|nr:biorientation of chromosomes in cell division protein 1-like 1 [Acanthaster planci]